MVGASSGSTPPLFRRGDIYQSQRYSEILFFTYSFCVLLLVRVRVFPCASSSGSLVTFCRFSYPTSDPVDRRLMRSRYP